VTGGFRAFWLLINIYHIIDDSDDDEVSSQLGVPLGINEGIRAKKQRRASRVGEENNFSESLAPNEFEFVI